MALIQLVTLLCVIQLFTFSVAVGRARGRFNIKVPNMVGHDVFERYVRVHMNSVELAILFLPSLWIAGQFWNPLWIAILGLIYLVGRIVYFMGYIRSPDKRHWGFILSVVPILILIILGLIGIFRSWM